MFTVSLLPSGPGPVPATAGHRLPPESWFLSTDLMGRGFNVGPYRSRAARFRLPRTSPPACRRFRVTGDAGPPGL